MVIQYGRKMTFRMRQNPCRKPHRRFAKPRVEADQWRLVAGASARTTDQFRIAMAFSPIIEPRAHPPIGVQGS